MSAASRCTRCWVELDPRLHAVCEVCRGSPFCAECTREHYCTGECEQRGCVRGLCVKLVRQGVVASDYGIPPTR